VSLRLRLAVWYGSLTGLAIALVCLVAYAMHSRAHYDEVDAALASAAGHIAEEYLRAATPAARAATMATSIAPGLVMRLLDRDGRVVAESSEAAALPPVDAAGLLAGGSRPAYDPIAAIAPAFASTPEGHGVFGVVANGREERWRLHALLVAGADQVLVVATPLGRLDASIARFRVLMAALALATSAATFGASWLLARGALRPVATSTAVAIARSRGFGRRVAVPPRRDELGQLATTFNEMLDSLEQAYRAEQRFVGDASHELRAPLTAIQANLELLERRPDMPAAERREAVAEASREARRLTQLVADLLALARADAGVALRRAPVELDRLLLDVLSEVRHLVRGQRLSVGELEPGVVAGDENRLRQLLVILLDNALKYTPAGGEVVVGLARTGGRAELTVSDTGVGIPPDELPRVFERFYRADRARTRDPGGTGLGLPIARWIVEQHGGVIALESEPGRGTTARVTLALAP
jgi:two-component system, OmpR family, sensor kinase